MLLANYYTAIDKNHGVCIRADNVNWTGTVSKAIFMMHENIGHLKKDNEPRRYKKGVLDLTSWGQDQAVPP